jgi:hypothetical protein
MKAEIRKETLENLQHHMTTAIRNNDGKYLWPNGDWGSHHGAQLFTSGQARTVAGLQDGLVCEDFEETHWSTDTITVIDSGEFTLDDLYGLFNVCEGSDESYEKIEEVFNAITEPISMEGLHEAIFGSALRYRVDESSTTDIWAVARFKTFYDAYKDASERVARGLSKSANGLNIVDTYDRESIHGAVVGFVGKE